MQISGLRQQAVRESPRLVLSRHGQVPDVAYLCFGGVFERVGRWEVSGHHSLFSVRGRMFH